MSEPVTEDKIHRIVGERVDTTKKEISAYIDETNKLTKSNREEIITLKIEQTKILGKLDSMYGNGSGKKGMLDRMEDKQKEDHLSLKIDLVETKQLMKEESLKQASFRHEIRGVLDALQNSNSIRLSKEEDREALAEAKGKLNGSWVKWIKYGVGVAGFLVWELLKHFVLHEKL